MMETKRVCGLGVLALVAIACSSGGSGGGSGPGPGNCNDISGTWVNSGTTCQGAPSTCTITQSGCSASANCDNSTQSLTVSGSTVSWTTAEGYNCSGTVSNSKLSGSCSLGSDSCQYGATCSQGSCGEPKPSGTGGASGTGGTPGTGGGSGYPGTGGTGGGHCGGTNYSNNPVCQSCMESSCCSQLVACAPGTSCEALLKCIVQYCAESITEQCIMQYCSNQLEMGASALMAMFDCDEANCSEQCSSGS
jgi:hypothetical protein